MIHFWSRECWIQKLPFLLYSVWWNPSLYWVVWRMWRTPNGLLIPKWHGWNSHACPCCLILKKYPESHFHRPREPMFSKSCVSKNFKGRNDSRKRLVADWQTIPCVVLSGHAFQGSKVFSTAHDCVVPCILGSMDLRVRKQHLSTLPTEHGLISTKWRWELWRWSTW